MDNCCYNRPFDNQNQLRIALETEAKLFIQNMIKSQGIDFVWSYVLLLENSRNTSSAKKNAISAFANRAAEIVAPSEEILQNAASIMATGIKAYDALHVACSISSNCDFLITTDDRLLKYQDSRIKIVDPIDFIKLIGVEADGE